MVQLYHVNHLPGLITSYYLLIDLSNLPYLKFPEALWESATSGNSEHNIRFDSLKCQY